MVFPISLARLEVAFSGLLRLEQKMKFGRKTGGIIFLCLKSLLGRS